MAHSATARSCGPGPLDQVALQRNWLLLVLRREHRGADLGPDAQVPRHEDFTLIKMMAKSLACSELPGDRW